MSDLVIRLRRFKTLDALEQVAARMVAKAAAVSFQDELNTIAALDHRRAEIATGRRYDVGKVPATAWALVD
ncbi:MULTISPECIES: Hha/YmoA family nucleoid-associated regulatory protein [Aeromonas]|uniref:Hha/YmoA family nucleoid-associated regulatory protein n=1 Tax=Aeromonas TaxID=642 RepID=UPI0005B3FAFF|nr:MULTISPECIES: Hha/YmoA family nucleoid-associated regulatory protein [Aeromonas]TNH76503.1 hypothetical protein CF142_04320 [Aeromonas caviae]